MKRSIQIVIVVGLSLATGCSRHDETVQPPVGFLSIGTNALHEAVPPGTHQKEVEESIGRPCNVIERGITRGATNSAGARVDVPVEVWVYACTNGSMWVIFGTNKVVDAIEPNPGVSI